MAKDAQKQLTIHNHLANKLLGHGEHEPSHTVDGIDRWWRPGSHDPREHEPPNDPSGNPIPELTPKDEDIDLADISGFPTTKGLFVDEIGNVYRNVGGTLIKVGTPNGYDRGKHGDLIPKAEGKKPEKTTALAWVKAAGSGALSNQEFKDGLKIINSSSPNESIRDERERMLIRQGVRGV